MLPETFSKGGQMFPETVPNDVRAGAEVEFKGHEEADLSLEEESRADLGPETGESLAEERVEEPTDWRKRRDQLMEEEEEERLRELEDSKQEGEEGEEEGEGKKREGEGGGTAQNDPPGIVENSADSQETAYQSTVSMRVANRGTGPIKWNPRHGIH
jgi:hypothetical protein